MGNRSNGYVEQEIKARLADPEALRVRLRGLGAERVVPPTREVNDLFDRPDGWLRGAGRVLRIRRYGEESILTLKGRAELVGGMKSRTEDETTVGDPEVAQRVLVGLGFERKFRYEKDREIWSFGTVEIAIDRTPLGYFLEIEGDEPEVRKAARVLSIDDDDVVPISYASLWREWRDAHPEAAPDMLFGDDPAAAS
jgi:adenylate cyclase class 2